MTTPDRTIHAYVVSGYELVQDYQEKVRASVTDYDQYLDIQEALNDPVVDAVIDVFEGEYILEGIWDLLAYDL